MDKREVCKEIGSFFGEYFEENGQLCIDNFERVFRYDTEDALLADWVDTLVESHRDTADNPKSEIREINDGWEKEILFIYQEVVGKYPAGVRAVVGKEGTKWGCSVDVTVPGDTSAHGKNLHLGTYGSIVDAIFARRAFLKVYETRELGLQELASLANKMREDAKALRAEHICCPHCGGTIDEVLRNAVGRAVCGDVDRVAVDKEMV